MRCVFCGRPIKDGQEMWVKKGNTFKPCHRDCDFKPYEEQREGKNFEQMLRRLEDHNRKEQKRAEERQKRWKR